MKRLTSAILAALLVAALGANPATADIAAVSPGGGAPVRFDITIAGKLIADGFSTARITVHGVDRFGNAAARNFPVTVSVASGSLLLREAGVAPGTQAASERVETKLGDDGSVTLIGYSTTKSGEVRINALADGVVAGGLSSATAFVAPYVKNTIVVGLATAGLGSVPGDVDGDDIFDNGNSNKGRIALYATGELFDKTVGTFAYESANRLDPTYGFGAYTFDPNERPYLTYGDNSTRSSDALSQGHFFGELDRGRDSLMYGEFNALTGDPSGVGTFQQLLSGVKLHLSNDSGSSSLTVFNAANNVLYGRSVFNPLGLADAGPVLKPDLIVGSDIVTVVALNHRSGAIVSQTQLVRNVDYVIDYASGTIRFITIPLPYDASFDPQVVVVQYQYDGIGTNAQTTGGSGKLSLGTTALEAGYANDANGVSNASVASQLIHGTLGAGSWQISHASTSGGDPTLTVGSTLAPTSGDNTHIAAEVPFGANRAYALYDYTTAGFDNVFGGFATPGLADLRFGWDHKYANGSTLTLGYDRESDAVSGNFQQQYGAKWHGKPTPRFSYIAGLEAVNASGYLQSGAYPVYPYPGAYTPALVTSPTSTSTSTASVPAGSTVQAEAGATWQVTPRVSASADHTFNLGGAVAAMPAETTAQLGYTLPNGLAYVRELWSDGQSYTVPQSTNDFSALSQATHATVVGISRDTSPMTSIGSAYVVEQTNDGTDAYTTYGVKQRFILDKQLQGDAFLQNGGGLGTGSAQTGTATATAQTGFTVWGVNLAYNSADHVRAALSWQDRSGLYSGTVLNLGASGRITPDFSLAANINSSRLTNYDADDTRIGLAWRPADNDRVAALLSFEDVSGQYTTAISDSTQVVTYDQLYRPTRQLELAGRIAYQLDGDSYYAAHTALFGLRAQQRIGPKADVAVEWQQLSTPAVANVAQTSFAVETGYRIGSSLRLAAGYNFSGSPDPALTGKPVRRGLYFTGTSTIDRIFGWGRLEPNTVP